MPLPNFRLLILLALTACCAPAARAQTQPAAPRENAAQQPIQAAAEATPDDEAAEAADEETPEDNEAAEAAPAAAARYWTTNWSFQDVDVAQLLDRLRSVGIEVPVEAEGDVSVAFTVSVPWNRLRDAQAYRFFGQLSSNRLRVEALQLEDFDAEINYAGGVLTLQNLEGRWVDLQQRQLAAGTGAGSFDGQARAQLVPRGNFSAALQANQLSLAPLRDLLLGAGPVGQLEPIGGVLQGNVQVEAPLQQIRDLGRWTLSADVQLQDFRIGPSPPLTADSGPVSIKTGVLKAPDVELQFGTRESSQLNVDVTAELRGQRAFEFSVRGNDVPLQTLADFGLDASLAQGKLDVVADGKGSLGSSLASATWNIEGRVGSPGLVLLDQELGVLEHRFVFDANRLELTPLDPEAAADFAAMRLRSVTADYEITEQSLAIRSLLARVYGGTIEGEATLARNNNTTHQFDLTWNGIRPVVDLRPILGLPAELAATTSGSMDWRVPAGQINTPASHQGTLQVSLQEVTLAGATIGQLDLQMVAESRTLQLTGTGTLFGGSVSVQTQTEIAADDTWDTLLTSRHQGDIEIQRANLAVVQRVLRPQDARRWSGRGSASIDLADTETDAADTLRQFVVSVEDLAIDGRRVARHLTSRLRYRDGLLIVDRASGSYAGGRIWVEGRWSLAAASSQQLKVRISAVNAGDALLTLSPEAAYCADGKISGWLTIAQGEQIRVRGAITARQSSLFSVPTGTVNTGVAATLSPDFSRWRVSMPSISGELAKGRIEGEAVLSSSSIRPGSFDLSSRWKARKVDFGMLLSEAQTEARFAHGRLTGALTLGGRAIRSVNDLYGTFGARLEATQPGAIPGLLEADRFLGLVSLRGAQFTDGNLQGIIAGGAARIDELLLQGSQAQMFAEGRVRLIDARMQLDVILSTGTYVPAERAAEFAAQLALQSVLPIATLIEINQLLSDRTVHLAFEGTFDDPRIRLKPLAIIREEVARLLIREALVAASANVDS